MGYPLSWTVTFLKVILCAAQNMTDGILMTRITLEMRRLLDMDLITEEEFQRNVVHPPNRDAHRI